MAGTFIDTAAQVKELVDKIEQWSPRHPFLFIDLEGINLSRHGSISIMQILVGPEKEVFLLDIHHLQGEAFHTASESGLTLHQILESEQYPKVIFDVRSDSDALYAHYNVDLHCVIDLQLLEFNTRLRTSRYLSGLAKCIELDAGLSYREVQRWNAVKEAGKNYFAPERGGRYEVFNERPLPAALTKYCVQDVQLMPLLLMKYAAKLRQSQAVQVCDETLARVLLSQRPTPLPKGREMAIGPTFRPTYLMANTTITVLKHPWNIVCSNILKSYCEPAAISQAASKQLTTVKLITPSTQVTVVPVPAKAEDTCNIQPFSIISSTTKPKPAPTVSQALQELSNRKTADFTLTPWGKYHDDSSNSDDIDNIENTMRSLIVNDPVSSALLSASASEARLIPPSASTHSVHNDSDDDVQKHPAIRQPSDFVWGPVEVYDHDDDYYNDVDDHDYSFSSDWGHHHDDGDEGFKDYTACSADGCGYCGNCGY